jgi:SAM-dependent methyltransferase
MTEQRVSPPPDAKGWTDFHKTKLQASYPRWPAESLLIALFGSALARRVEIAPGMRVLDVGCGFGNNLMPFLERGLECHGTEIAPDMIASTERILRERGHKAHLHLGTNRELPFETGTFDLLVSVNVLHYEPTEDGIRAGLREYARVLKPQGALFLSTTGDRHSVYRAAKTVGPHLYKYDYDDFRKGQQFFYFDNEKYLSHYLGEAFADVETGRYTLALPKATQDYLIAVARDKRA